MVRLLKLMVAIAAGLALGLSVTRWAVSGMPPFGAAHSGAWTAWPGSGTPDADPYARAVFATDGRLPLAAAAGLRFLASRDDSGAALTGRCEYRVEGQTPEAQYWTLTLLDPRGLVPTGPGVRHGFTSAEITRASGGAFALTVADQARSGDWLPSAGTGPFVLLLSFYDTPLTTAILNGTPSPPLPAIVRSACR